MTRPRVGSLCSGYEGIGLALEQLVDAEVVWQCEYDDAPARILAHHYPDVPNHRDLTTVDWTTLPPVDILCAGYPCQPFSHAGKRKGTNDDRHLWPHIARAIGVLRPRVVVLENVAGHLTLGFDTVLGDLAALGYDARWGTVRAADAGAPHSRARLFVIATDTTSSPWGIGDRDHEPAAQDADGAACDQRRLTAPRQEEGRGPRADAGGRDRAPVADPDDQGQRDGRSSEGRWAEPLVSVHGAIAADAGHDPRASGVRQRLADPHRGSAARGEGDQARPAGDAGRGTDAGHVAADADDLVLGLERGGLASTPPSGERGRAGVSGRPAHRGRAAATDAERLPHGEHRDARGMAGAPAGGAAADGDEARPGAVGGGAVSGRGTPAVPSGRGADPVVTWGPYAAAIARWELVSGRVAPAPTETSTRGAQRLSPAFVEWMMGLPAGWVTEVPGLTRTAMLKALGNGVVPQQAALALRALGLPEIFSPEHLTVGTARA